MNKGINMSRIFDIGVKVLFGISLIILFMMQLKPERKVVYVDVQKLGAEYKGMQAARKEFEGKTSVWQANLDTLRTQVQKKMIDYEKTKTKLSASEKKLTEEVIRSKQEQYQSYEQAIREKVQTEDKQLTAKVVERMNDYIKEYGKKKGYTVILAATQYGNILYAEDEIDITAEILKGLNDQYK